MKMLLETLFLLVIFTFNKNDLYWCLKDLHDPDNHDGVITHLEPDILECEIKWALKHHYEQSQWKWWNSRRAISNPERWCHESAALNKPANLENSAVATGLEKFSFHSNLKGRQCQRMLKLPHNCTHLTRYWRRQWHPTPVLLPGKSHGQRGLVGCSPWGG